MKTLDGNNKERKKLIRTVNEAVLAKALLDEQSITNKALSLSLLLQRMMEKSNVEITSGVKSMAYRFLRRLLKLELIDPYYHMPDNPKITFFIFTVKKECISRLQEEIHNLCSKICQ